LPDDPLPSPFSSGVASGDPEADGVVLWTRVEPGAGAARTVRWEVGLDPDMRSIVADGVAEATADRDHTVHVDVRDLDPSTTYHYRFEADGLRSPVGRTRTAPSGPTGNVRLGLVSCASWASGYFNAYAHLAEQDVDLVLHVGDYVYENGPTANDVRAPRPSRRLRSLADYRTRHAQHRSDPDLQRLHQQHPVVAVWDDHDLAGNAWRDGAVDHDPQRDGEWSERRAAAAQAYLEWLPVRLPDPATPDRIHRTLRLGDLANLIVLDTRLVGRDRPARGGTRAVAAVLVRDRSLLGAEQRAWLQDELRAPTTWRLLGNQVMMAPLRLVDLPRPLRRLPGLVSGGAGVNAGQWDGYPEERRALFEHVRREGIGDLVVLTGDIHSSWAAELVLDPKDPVEVPVGVELVTPSVTSASFAELLSPPVPGGRALLRRVVASQNRHVRFFDLGGHGFVVVDVERDRVHADWWHVDTVARRASGARVVASWEVRHGDPHLRPAAGPLPPRARSSPGHRVTDQPSEPTSTA
jgi:alkaline phosphatase D